MSPAPDYDTPDSYHSKILAPTTEKEYWDSEEEYVDPDEAIWRNEDEHRLNTSYAVGNFGIYFGNWGTRPTNLTKEPQRKKCQNIDLQIEKNPAQIIILTEADEESAERLRLTEVAERPDSIDGDSACTGLEARPAYRHHSIRG